MKKTLKLKIFLSASLIFSFILWTALVSFIDVQPIGPLDSKVGFARLNGAFHRLTGVHLVLYDLTDILSFIPIGICVLFAVIGLIQLIKRKSLLKTDPDIIALGVFYIVTFASFLLFEVFVINYRPVLIDGALEASYPSSTTLLCSCILPTAIMQFKWRIKSSFFRRCTIVACGFFCAFMVICRLISGVHWITDIMGGALLSAGLVLLYGAVCTLTSKK